MVRPSDGESDDCDSYYWWCNEAFVDALVKDDSEPDADHFNSCNRGLTYEINGDGRDNGGNRGNNRINNGAPSGDRLRLRPILGRSVSIPHADVPPVPSADANVPLLREFPECRTVEDIPRCLPRAAEIPPSIPPRVVEDPPSVPPRMAGDPPMVPPRVIEASSPSATSSDATEADVSDNEAEEERVHGSPFSTSTRIGAEATYSLSFTSSDISEDSNADYIYGPTDDTSDEDWMRLKLTDSDISRQRASADRRLSKTL